MDFLFLLFFLQISFLLWLIMWHRHIGFLWANTSWMFLPSHTICTLVNSLTLRHKGSLRTLQSIANVFSNQNYSNFQVKNILTHFIYDVVYNYLFTQYFSFSFLQKHKWLNYILIFVDRWFLGFDWDGLRTRSLQPPIIPKVRITTPAFLAPICVQSIKTMRNRLLYSKKKKIVSSLNLFLYMEANLGLSYRGMMQLNMF